MGSGAGQWQVQTCTTGVCFMLLILLPCRAFPESPWGEDMPEVPPCSVGSCARSWIRVCGVVHGWTPPGTLRVPPAPAVTHFGACGASGEQQRLVPGTYVRLSGAVTGACASALLRPLHQ